MILGGILIISLFHLITGDSTCYEVEFEPISNDLLCTDNLNDPFEYYFSVRDSLTKKFVGHTVVLDDACLLKQVNCGFLYCIGNDILEDIENLEFVVIQTRLRRNFGKDGTNDRYWFTLFIDGEEQDSIVGCKEQLNKQNASDVCMCDEGEFSRANAASNRNQVTFAVPSKILEDESNEASFLSPPLYAGLGIGVLVAMLAAVAFVAIRPTSRRLRRRHPSLSSASLADLEQTDIKLKHPRLQFEPTKESSNPKYTENFTSSVSFSQYLDEDLRMELEKPQRLNKKTKSTVSKEDIQSVEIFREFVKSKKFEKDRNSKGSKSYGRSDSAGSDFQVSSAICFKTEQRMIKLKEVLIERMIFLSIESLQVAGPGQTPRSTPFMKYGTESIRNMSLGDFMEILRKAVNEFTEEDDEEGNSLGNKCLLIALVYLRRAKEKRPSLFINDANIRNLIFVSVLVATKYMDDYVIPNSHWAEVVELDLEKINKMELSFCKMMGYEMFVSAQEVRVIVAELESSNSHKF